MPQNFFIRFWKNRKLEFDIIAEFVILMLATSLSIMWYSFSNNSKSFMGFSNTLAHEVTRGVITNTMFYLEDAKVSTNLGAYLMSKPEEITIDNELLRLYMIGLLQSYTYLKSVYVGGEKGNFFEVRQLDPGATYRTHPTERLPGGIKFAIRYIDRSQETARETWLYTDENGEIREREEVEGVRYDHKTRPWYIKARQERSFIWTDIYLFAVEKLPGLTAAQPLYTGIGNSESKGQFFGVIGADLRVEDLSKFLIRSNLGEKGVAFIVDTEDGELISHPDPSQTFTRDENGVTAMTQLHELSDRRLTTAFQRRLNLNKTLFDFSYNGQDLFSLFIPFPDELGKKWEVGIVAPKDVFLKNINRTQREIILMAIAIFTISIFLIILLARNLSRPIVMLAKEADKIKHFDLSSSTSVESNVAEIKLLSESISSMRKSLQAFAKFAPKEIVKKLTKRGSDVKIGGRERNLTIFFSDIESFTSISEKYSPEKLMPHLSEYFEELTQIIQKTNGTIDKYIGDAIMAFWGAPFADRQHALNACIAALHCQRRLVALNRKWRLEKKPELRTRIGLHSGETIVGNVGSSDRMNYTALGDSVNLAARLEGANKLYDTNILISHAVYYIVQKHVVARPIDIVAVKGRRESIRIYELIGMKSGDPELLPSKDKIKYADMFTKAFTHYLEQRWDDAITMLEEIKKAFGSDVSVDMYIQRCEDFKKKGPGDDWDGVERLKKK